MESGPFHSQGRAGASTHPWQGIWNGNVSVTLVSCNIPRPTIRYKVYTSSVLAAMFNWIVYLLSLSRWNSQSMDEMQRMREREREMNLMKNMKNMHQPMDGGVYLNP